MTGSVSRQLVQEITQASRGTVVLRTETGAITIGTPAGVCAALDAGTTLGRIRNTLTSTGTAPPPP
jgi:hypothetical protein